MESENYNLNLQLGDIIKIDSPRNDDLHDKIFYINYINNEKIILLNDEKTITLSVSDTGKLLEESIDNILLLYRHESPSFIVQNNIKINKFISIYFGDPVPSIINGIITNIEEDMIEIKLLSNNEVIYIDFAYSGIPENLNIEKIIIRNGDDVLSKNEKESLDTFNQGEENSENPEIHEMHLDQNDEYDYELVNYNENEKLNELLLDSFELEDTYEELYHSVNVPDNEKRYTIESQIQDYIETMLAKKSHTDINNDIINKLNKEINRYKELRNTYSVFDKNNNPLIPREKTEFDKPLKEILHNLNKKLYWIIPVINYKKTIINNNVTLLDDSYQDYLNIINEADFIKKLIDTTDKWINNNSKEKINDYKNYINDLLKIIDNVTYNNTEEDESLLLDVNTQINVINDMFDDFYSYVNKVNNKDQHIDKERFVMEIFNSGMKMIEKDYKDNKNINKVSDLTLNDKINIISFITLPLPIFNFSKINMDYTSILKRCEYSEKYLNYYQILNVDTNLNRYIIDKTIYDKFLNTHLNIHNNNLLTSINSFSLDNTIDLNSQDKYNILLESFIPTNNSLIKILSENKKYYNQYSFIDDLQCANIDLYNLHTKDHTNIMSIINNNIISFKENFQNNKNILIKLLEIINEEQFKNINTFDKYNYSFDLLTEDLKNELFQNYNMENRTFNSNLEILSYFEKIDNSKLFLNTLNKSIMDLIIANLVENFAKQNSEETKEEEKEEKINELDEKCEKYFLSKKYSSISELEEDNNKDLYFDSIYDNTIYSLIDEYKTEKDAMDSKQFYDFLTNKLKDLMNLSTESAKREAKSIINEKRQVIDGDYALLIDNETNKNFIYIRNNNIWELDDKFKSDFYIDSNKILCDINKDCISINDKCISNETMKQENIKNDVDKILENFKLKYHVGVEEIKGQITLDYDNAKTYIKKIHKINKNKEEKLNNYLLDYFIEVENIHSSPYNKLRDSILSIPNIVKRNYLIKKFCINFTREAINDENIYWLYCNKTGIKLIPKFLLRLANVFDDKNNYLRTIDTICAEQGTISDDNSYWVDKYSGYIIKHIEFSSDEGFDEQGYKLNTKELIENEYSINIVNKSKSSNPNIDTINAIIKAMTQMMGITINNHEFIINNVLLIQKKTVPSKEDYEKQIDKLKKKDPKSKTLPSYEDTFDSTLLLLTLTFLIVAIQSSIPSVISKKTFPGCIKSFDGYPFSGDQDKTAVIYIACVANKIKSSIKPWNSLLKVSESTIVKKITNFIEKYVVTNKEINDLFDKKKEYLLLNQDVIIPESLSINTWHNFMPPLKEINIDKSSLIPLPDTFKSELLETFTKGAKNNIEEVTQSKIIFFSNAIIQFIEEIVKSKSVLLENNTGEPFLENACCNSSLNTSNYFTNINPTIIEYNDLIKFYCNITESINTLIKAPLLFDNNNTKNVLPIIKSDFSEATIYKTFIHFCNFDNSLPIDDDLRSICIDKPIDFEYDNDFNNVIESLKSQGKNYTKNNMLDLLTLIGKKNFIQTNIKQEIVNNVEMYKLYINNYNLSVQENKIDDLLFDKLALMIDNFKINNEDNKELDDVKNHLARINNIMKQNILQFIKKIPNFDKQVGKNIEKYLNFKISTNNVKFYKTYIKNLIDIFPNIIIKKTINYSAIPEHWNLSQLHNNDISDILKRYYDKLMTFSDIPEFEIIFKIIKQKCYILQRLVDNTFYNESINISNSNKNLKIYSIFDEEYIKYFFTYCFYSIFNELVNITENSQFKLDITSIDDYDEDILNEKIGNFIHESLNIMMNHNTILESTYSKVKEKITFSKEKEKDLITDYLKQLTDEEREIENLFKNNKLEKWSKGLQKGLTQYVKENYDEERMELEKQAQKELKLKQNNNVTEMNKEIYNMDLDEQEKNDKEIEDEELDMSNIPDDDDYDSDYEYY